MIAPHQAPKPRTQFQAHEIMRLHFGLLGLLSLFSSCASTTTVDAPARPNVVLIMVDDLGLEAIGCYGGTSYATPRVDALAARGMRFDHAYSQTLCTPSRVKLMTGRGNLRNYVHFSILDPAERTIGDVAREAGYATAVVGKWQLLGTGRYGEWAGRGTHPADAGFDEWCLWQVSELGSRYGSPSVDVNGEFQRDVEGGYGPDLFCDYLLDFASREREQPFFVYYPMVLTHEPFEATPASPRGERSKQELFADMVSYMDGIVGRIEDGLVELGLREQTLLIFTTDNGSPRGVRSGFRGRELRGGKTLSTDAGTHVPLIVSWPGVVEAGSACGDLVDFSDFLPTLAEVMRADLPDEPILDGRSFAAQLRGERGSPREALTIYSNPRPPGSERNPRVCFARDERYKLYDDGRFFDCVADPDESSPLDLDTLEPGLREVHAKLTAHLAALPEEPAHLLPSAE